MEYQPKRYTGRLSKWQGTWGFIRFENRDLFVHRTAYLGGFTPELHSIVEFEIGPSIREDKFQDQAYRVRVVKTADDVLREFNEKREFAKVLRGLGGSR